MPVTSKERCERKGDRKDNGESLREDDEYSYDLFGLKRIAADSRVTKPWTIWLIWKSASSLILIVSLLPIFLLLFLSITVSANPDGFLFYLTLIMWGWMAGFLACQLRLVNTKNARLPHSRPSYPQPAKAISVAVIGAGPVGLAVIKECLAQGVNVICFETKSGVGGVYHFQPDKPGGVWSETRLTSSPWITAFSDFPPASQSSEQLKHNEYLAYLQSYTGHFQLKSRIRFNHHVEKIEPSEAGWQVTANDLRNGNKHSAHFDFVAVCSGLSQTPRAAPVPGTDTFTGNIRHASSYRQASEFRDKRVLVVGLGESGADIAGEISQFASKTLLSIARGKFVIPRINPLTGRANDYDTNRLRNSVPPDLRDGYMSFRRKLCRYLSKHTPGSAVRDRLLQLSAAGATSQTATKSDDFINSLLEGKLAFRPKLEGFNKNNVIFTDGKCDEIDEVIFAHGYCPSFPFLSLPADVPSRSPQELYLHMFHPETGNSLAFCGFARPALGAIPPTGELQARLFAQIVSGNSVLPDKQRMLDDIAAELRESSQRFPLLPEGHVVVPWIPYMDMLAALIGCRPAPWKLLFTSPPLLWKIATGPFNGAQYRLHGPGKSDNARQTLLMLPRDHRLQEIAELFGLHFWIWPLTFFNAIYAAGLMLLIFRGCSP